MRGMRIITHIAIVEYVILFFFFQAEDGIRDYKVTGVQTCALPIFVIESGDPTGHGFDHVFARRGIVLKHKIQPSLAGNLAKTNGTHHGWREDLSAGLREQKSARSN